MRRGPSQPFVEHAIETRTCDTCGEEYKTSVEYCAGRGYDGRECPGCAAREEEENKALAQIANRVRGWVDSGAGQLAGDIIDGMEERGETAPHHDLVKYEAILAVRDAILADNDATRILQADHRELVYSCEMRVVEAAREEALVGAG